MNDHGFIISVRRYSSLDSENWSFTTSVGWIRLIDKNSLLKIRRRQTSVTVSGSEITARKTSGCRRCKVSRRSGLVCDVKKSILPSRVKRE